MRHAPVVLDRLWLLLGAPRVLLRDRHSLIVEDLLLRQQLPLGPSPPAAVWPWLVQMGQGWAGFYSNSCPENLTGADIHNADAIHSEWQQRVTGDIAGRFAL